jgi:hypothetical protein
MLDSRSSDADLISAFRRRDSSAAEHLYSRFAPRVVGLGMVIPVSYKHLTLPTKRIV